jgi:lipid-A-disaccharide synthase
MQSADVVLVTSGTVTLEAMLLLRPMIVAYKVSFITAWLLRLSGLVKIDRFALPNLLANANLVPELIQEHANGPELGDAVLALIDGPEKRAEQQQEFDALGNILRLSANESAAQVILKLLGKA